MMLAPLLPLLLAAPAGTAPPPPAAEIGLAAKTFQDVCLGHSASAAAARDAAAAAGFAKGQTLPGLAGGAPLEAYEREPLELVVREQKDGQFGCLILFRPEDSAPNSAVAAAVGALPGLSAKSGGGSDKRWRQIWSVAGPPEGSKVFLAIDSGIGWRSAILTLESKAKK
jgi:hypothetical protein